MTRDLSAEVSAYLAEHGESTALQVARGVTARTRDVIALLRSGAPFSGPFRGADGRLYYRLAAERERPPGTRSRGIRTHCERVLDLLADGAWHSHHEGYQLGVMLHSRVAELRTRGYVIETKCDRVGHENVWSYRLVTPVAEAVA